MKIHFGLVLETGILMQEQKSTLMW